MREHKLLQEAVANLHTDAFEQWHPERNDDAQLSDLQKTFCDILCILQNDGSNTNETRFLLTPYSNNKTIDIVIRFMASHRAGNWENKLV